VIRADSFEAFEAAARAAGFDEVVLDTHTHPFAVDALVVRGSVTLHSAGQQRLVSAGQGFELAPEAPHAEHYGPEGATFWVARRH
jgi:AraC-like ligand binding domain